MSKHSEVLSSSSTRGSWWSHRGRARAAKRVGKLCRVLHAVQDHQEDIVDDFLPGGKNQSLETGLPLPHGKNEGTIPPVAPLTVSVFVHDLGCRDAELVLELAVVAEWAGDEILHKLVVPLRESLVGLGIQSELERVTRDLGFWGESGIIWVGLFLPFEEAPHRVDVHLVDETQTVGAQGVVALVLERLDLTHGFDRDGSALAECVHSVLHLGGHLEPGRDLEVLDVGSIIADRQILHRDVHDLLAASDVVGHGDFVKSERRLVRMFDMGTIVGNVSDGMEREVQDRRGRREKNRRHEGR